MVEQRVQRRLAAILAADVVGYSRMMEADEAGTLARLKALRAEFLHPKVTEYGGRIVKTTGDGTLVEFPSAVDAVSHAVDVQAELARRNADLPEGHRIELRMGINVGDIIIDGDDIYGDGVNVAARLEAMADPDGICISARVHDYVGSRLDLGFDDLGLQTLKNIAEPVHVYRVRLDGGAKTAADALRDAPPLPDKPSIAVLPFTNMSGDPEQEYFSDGISEDIITALSRFRWFFVIARNSTFTYKGKAVDVRQVGRELGVRYVLEGSVRRNGNRLRITAQLVDASNGNHLWAERFDGEAEDVFDLQDKITEGVVSAVEPSVRHAEIERVRRKRPGNLDAYDIVLKAWPLLYSRMPEDADRAIPLFKQALELDPTYALAHAALAWCFHARFFRAGRNEEDDRAATHHAKATIAAGSDDATALTMAAFVLATACERDSETALRLIDRAFNLSPSCTFALGHGAIIYMMLGNTDFAIHLAQKELRLNPIDPFGYAPHAALSYSYFSNGNFEWSAAEARRAIEKSPRFSISYAFLAASLARLGQMDDAIAAARHLLVLQPGFTIGLISAEWSVPPKQLAPFLDALREVGLPD